MLFKKKNTVDAFLQRAERVAKQTYDRAHYKLHRRANEGDQNAAITMGRYWLGDGPSIDHKIAIGYLEGPAQAGNEAARMLILASMLDGINDPLSSFGTWKAMLGLKFSVNIYNERYRWMAEEADKGGMALQALVGLLEIRDGDITAKIAAFGKLHKYALDGSSPAAAAVASCHLSGEGTPTNYVAAYTWFSVAKSLGLRSVDDDMAHLAEKLPPDRLLGAQQDATHIIHYLGEKSALPQPQS